MTGCTLFPPEMNAHILTIILLNTAFLFGSIRIIACYCRSRLFLPTALAISLYFIYAVNLTIPGSAVVSVWPPHVILFCFLFFITASASVASGNLKQLPGPYSPASCWFTDMWRSLSS